MNRTLKDISVIIVTYKGDELTKDCLDSLAATCADEPQVVVVDNSPSEATERIVAAHPNAVYVASPGNPGFAGGNNLGLLSCDRRYVLLLNNDTIVHSRESIGRLAEFMDEHPQCGVAQGTMRLPRCGGTLDDCGTYLKWYGVQRHRFFRKPDPGNLKPVRVFAAKGAFMMVRRSAIDRLEGTLFHGHFGSFFEETDFCHRVWISGLEVWFVPTPPIDHLLGATSSKFDNAAIWRQYMANIFFSFRANFSAYGKLRILLPFCAVYCAYTLLQLARLRLAHFTAMLAVPLVNFRRRGALREAKEAVGRVRRVADRELLRVFMQDV